MLLNDLILNFGALVYRDQALGDYVEFVSNFAFYDDYFILVVVC